MLSSPRLALAFDAGSVSGALLARGLKRPKIKAFARVSLDPGALVPGPFETNLVRREEVLAAAVQVRGALAAGSRRPALVLVPDGVARTVLLELPEGVKPLEFARFRLDKNLPYDAEEAVVDGLPAGRDRLLAAAARRSVLTEYESCAEDAGFRQERLDLTPLTAVAGLLRGRHSEGPEIGIVLGDVALALAVGSGTSLSIFRNRRRSGVDEWSRLAEEIKRVAGLAGDGPTPAVRVVGSDSGLAVEALRSLGLAARAGWSELTLPPGAEQAAWLGGLA